jgi:tetraacyldisaccharide 4'-kinase
MGAELQALLNITASFAWSAASAASRVLTPLVRPPFQAGVRVISVGNIQAGGSGKTPLTAEIARQGVARGLSVCILLRGYGSEWERSGGVIAPSSAVNSTAMAPAIATAFCGDEAALLHDLVPQAWIGVGANRVEGLRSVRALAEKIDAKIDLIVLDDGFQNHQLKKDLEIVALTPATRGQKPFRDFDSALKHADLVILTKGENHALHSDRPTARAQFKIREAPSQAPVLLVTAVADGEQVERSVKAAGYRVARHRRFADHAFYGRATVESLVMEAKTEGLQLAMTGKDWVKWKEISADSSVWVLEPQVVLDSESETVWNRIIWFE